MTVRIHHTLIVRLMFLTAFLLPAVSGVLAQTITPVDRDDEKPRTPTLHYYDKHGNKLDTPVLFLATLDTVSNASPAAIYPRFNGVTIGGDFFDAIMLAAGQKHASFSLSADVSILNWIFPVIEAGIGYGSDSPEGMNFSYKANPSLFFKAGINYNFLYKSNPAYQALIGFRAAYTSFSYSITGISVSSPYWGEAESFSIENQRASAFYGEALAGLRVKIYRGLSLGWTIRYNFKFKTTEPKESTPWFIPGYGAGSPISATFSIFYTFGRHDKPTSVPQAE